MISQLPNIISVFRILVSCLLFILIKRPVLFFTAYILCGISDALDGYIARRFKWESRAGAGLDSISDLIFYAIIVYLLFSATDISSEKWFLTGFIIIFVIRILNFLITRIKFREWGMLHSWANKLAGLLLFCYIPFALVSGYILLVPGLILFASAFISAIEETAILLSAKKYNVNKKSLFFD